MNCSGCFSDYQILFVHQLVNHVGKRKLGWYEKKQLQNICLILQTN